MKRFVLLSPVLIVVLTFGLAACGGQKESPAPESAEPSAEAAPEVRVFFVEPADSSVVPTTFHVVMGVKGLSVAPAGEVKEGSGHLHILVDTTFVPAGQVIPKDEHHLHFGAGALEADLTLPPGPHTLRLQFADGAHVALEGDRYRDEIHVTVQ